MFDFVDNWGEMRLRIFCLLLHLTCPYMYIWGFTQTLVWQNQSRGCNLAPVKLQHWDFKHGYLLQELGEEENLAIALFTLAHVVETLEEPIRAWRGHVELESFEDVVLHFYYFGMGELVVTDLEHVIQFRTIDFLVLGWD